MPKGAVARIKQKFGRHWRRWLFVVIFGMVGALAALALRAAAQAILFRQ